MQRQGLILLMAVLLALPVFSIGLTGCAKKPVQPEAPPTTPPNDGPQTNLEEEELRRLREKFVNEMIHFDFDRYDIRPEAAQILNDKARYMNANNNLTVLVEGHCDERGTEAYNYALGDRRAKSAKRFMETLGISGMQMSTVSYGEERPLDSSQNENAWSLNRRAVFVIQ